MGDLFDKFNSLMSTIKSVIKTNMLSGSINKYHKDKGYKRAIITKSSKR